MGKIKIHEIAKEINLTSKEIIKRAEELKIDVKNHMSSIEEELAKKIKESFKTNKKEENKTVVQEKKEKKSKQDIPVIIRREVIVSEEELAKQEEEEKKRKMEQKQKEVGFVERKNNKDFNIVYRNKPSKPMTVSELFGLKTPKQEEIKEEPKIDKKVEVKKEVVQRGNTMVQEQRKPKSNGYQNNNGYRNHNQNNGYNNNGYNNNYRSRDNNNNNFQGSRNNGFNQNRDGGAYRNNNQNGGGYHQNRPNNGGYRNNHQNGYGGKRPLDEKGIEKNIKNIMTDVAEKEVVREYNKSIDKQKQNRYEENKMKKAPKTRRGGDYEINEDKLKSLKQHDRLSSMFDEQDGGMLDFYDLTTQRGKKNKKRVNKQQNKKYLN